jgi:hypothetical protein
MMTPDATIFFGRRSRIDKEKGNSTTGNSENPPMKRYLALLLFLILTAGLALPAAAADQDAHGSKPKSAIVTDTPAESKDYNVGNIKVTFADGHSEMLTNHRNSSAPKVAGSGIVGWIQWGGLDAAGRRQGKDTVRIRLAGGSFKDFAANPAGGQFIMDWGFADHDSAVVVKSMGHHGPASFIKYDIASGKATGHQDSYLPIESMAAWAKPYAD